MKKVVALVLSLVMGVTISQAQTSKDSKKVNNLKTNKMTPKEVVEAYSIALSKGDVSTAFSYFSPNAKWHQPGKNKFSGTQAGLEAIGKMLSEMMAVTQGSLAIKPAGAMMVNGNFVSCPVRFSAKIGNKSVEMNGNDLFEVVDGKIVQVWLFSEDQVAEDLFWN
jgi:limonene-1,2-epoxide hydrolase